MALRSEDEPLPASEGERLKALRQYRILDTQASRTFDRIAARAARLTGAPIALISFVDENRVWFKSHHGLKLDEIGRQGFFCSEAILSDEVMIVPDAAADARFATHPFVAVFPGARFYAGAPLRTPDGFRLGTLAVLDPEPRDGLAPEQQAALRRLAALVIDELDLRLLARDAAESGRARGRTDRLLAAAFENAPAALAILGEDGMLLAANRRYCALAGREPAELIGRAPALDGAAASGDGRPTEWRLRRGDGSEAVFLGSLSHFGDSSGRNLKVLAALDVEEAMARREAVAWAEKVDALSRMAGRASHDLNNLLMIIMGFSQLLKNNVDPGDPLGEFAEEILKAGDRAAQLAGEFLTFSGRRIGRAELLDVNELLASLAARLKEAAGPGIEIAAECAPGLPPIRGDRAHLGKAIARLVANAAEAMPAGGRVAVATSLVEPDSACLAAHPGMRAVPHVVLTVRDDGPGMDPDMRKRLCEPFFTTRAGRAGFGLTAVYGTVRQCGGCLSIASDPGKGTAVFVYLPAVFEGLTLQG